MRRQKIIWQIFPSFLLITLCSLLAFTWYISSSFREFYLTQVAGDLESRAHLVREQVVTYFDSNLLENIDLLCKQLGKTSQTRITIILPSGKVIGDSDKVPENMDNHYNRPEIIEALMGNISSKIRYSQTLQKEMMYVAIPTWKNQKIIAITRVALSIEFIGEALTEIQTKLLIGWLVVTGIATFIILFISRRITHPIEKIKQGAFLFAKGELNRSLSLPKSEELAELAETLNDMAAQLEERIKTISDQNHVQEVILSSMIESLIAVDTQQILINLNQSAAKLFNTKVSDAKGHHLTEIVRNAELQRFVNEVLESETPLKEEISLYDNNLILQANGTALKDMGGNGLGALIVMNDITHMRRMEQIRKDFVANVSHELKTPITSIKGAAETLIDGACENPEDARRFLLMITRHADRLNGIIEDLLILSKIEQDGENESLELTNTQISKILSSAIQICKAKANQQHIELKLSTTDSLYVKANAPLLEQAVVNLIDNAIKYSASNTIIEIEAIEQDSQIALHVKDQGIGIAQEEQSRLFERFYRVDKARSRKLGGTGLGLAIVKHIAQAHSGYSDVKSTLGKGSTFSIYLPRL